jgi:hypothetical protein
MPHPERASNELLGSVDGRILLDSFLSAARFETAAAASRGPASRG